MQRNSDIYICTNDMVYGVEHVYKMQNTKTKICQKFLTGSLKCFVFAATNKQFAYCSKLYLEAQRNICIFIVNTLHAAL